ncbi:MAG: hypothetical protein HY763_08700 [Planctomycetes bacterium]|nr:hypothetical protein [Planctomycetota bacterium]
MRRLLRCLGVAVVLSLGPCLPNNYFSSLFSSSLSAVTGVVLSDFLSVVLPPPQP